MPAATSLAIGARRLNDSFVLRTEGYADVGSWHFEDLQLLASGILIARCEKPIPFGVGGTHIADLYHDFKAMVASWDGLEVSSPALRLSKPIAADSLRIALYGSDSTKKAWVRRIAEDRDDAPGGKGPGFGDAFEYDAQLIELAQRVTAAKGSWEWRHAKPWDLNVPGSKGRHIPVVAALCDPSLRPHAIVVPRRKDREQRLASPLDAKTKEAA